MTGLWQEMKDYASVHNVPILRDAELPIFCGIVSSARPRRVLEIGTAIGYSTLRMASCMDDGATITTIELDRGRACTASRFIRRSPYAGRIVQRVGDAAQWLERLDGPWDFVFLDGPKGQYSRQLRLLLPKLFPGAVIAADNIDYHDMLYTKGWVPHKHRTAVERLREFLRLVNDERYFDTVFLENGDGMTVSRWKG